MTRRPASLVAGSYTPPVADRVTRAEIDPGSGAWRDQFRHLRVDAEVVVAGRRSRYLSLPWSEGFLAVAVYRLNRAGWLAFGRRWSIFRAVTAPLWLLVRVVVRTELDHRADLGPGVRVLHPQLGVVIGGGVVAGRRLILAGGNVIGDGNVVLGDHVQLGANAVVVGDLELGDGVILGAGAVATRSFVGPGLLVGVPARPVDPR